MNTWYYLAEYAIDIYGVQTYVHICMHMHMQWLQLYSSSSVTCSGSSAVHLAIDRLISFARSRLSLGAWVPGIRAFEYWFA